MKHLSAHRQELHEGVPWSVSLIERFNGYWNWNTLSRNERLPWSPELIDRFIDRWKWGYFEPSEEDANEDSGERGLIGNNDIPWDIDLIIRYEKLLIWRR